MDWIWNNDVGIQEFKWLVACVKTTASVSKAMKLVIDFKKWDGAHTHVCINGAEVGKVENFGFLGVNIANSLS